MKKNFLNPIIFTVVSVFSIVIYLLTIVSAYGGHINPNTISTPSLLCLFMPYLGLLSVILIIFWACCKNIFYTAFGVISLIICIPSMSRAVPIGFPREGEAGKPEFTVISWNVLHTEDVRKPDYPGNRAVEFMVNSEADIICLTELYNFSPQELRKASTALIDSLKTAYPYRAGLSSTDIKVISKYPVERMDLSLIDREGRHRFDFFKVKFPANELIVAMVHLYSYGLSDEERNVVTEINSVKTAKKSVKEFKGSIMTKMKEAFRMRAENASELRKIIDEIPEEQPLVVCGDFNDVPSSWTYNIISGDDMRDLYSETNIGPAFTYNLHRFYFHIDQMLYRGALEGLSLKVGKINTSDHYPLIGKFQFTSPGQVGS